MRILGVTSVNNEGSLRRGSLRQTSLAVAPNTFAALYKEESSDFKKKKERAQVLARIICVLSVVTAIYYFYIKKMGK